MTPCDSQPCNNGGKCTSDSDGFSCSCTEGFSGKYCELVQEKEAICNLKCENGGKCLDIGENELICVCPLGNY